MQNLETLIEGKKILFVTTKNIDYIRNSQEIRLINQNAELTDLIYSGKQQYICRIIEVWIKLWLYDMKRIDVVFVGFAPQLVLPFFYWKLKNKLIIIDFFISVYDTLVHDRKIFKDKGIVARLCHWLDSIILKKADYVITDTNADAKYFIREFKSNADKFETLYLEADSSIYYPREQHKRDDLVNKFVVLYFGSILPLQGVEVVLDTIKLLKDQENIYFQIIGPVSDKYDKPMQDNVEYIDWLRQEELADYIANADLCLAGHFNGEIDKASRTIPGKAFIYEAMAKTMIMGENKANKELFQQENRKIHYVQMGNEKALADKIILIFEARSFIIQ